MPNWIRNKLKVDGFPGDVMCFVAAMKSDLCVFDFNNIRPIPPVFNDIKSGRCLIDGLYLKYWRVVDNKNIALTGDELDGLNKVYGACDSVDWSRRWWGTKWNAVNVYVNLGVNSVEYTFDTAWSPPYPVIGRIVEMHPKLNFRLTSKEENDAHRDL